MLAMGRLAKAAVVIGAMVAFAGCSSDDKDPAPDKTLLDINEMRGALLQAADIGPTWTAPAESTDPNRLVSVCGGTTTAPPVPPGATVVAAPLVDEGDAGAQTLNQTALVYDDPSGSQAGLAALRAVADGCQASVSVPATVTNDKSEPAYTETAAVQPLSQGSWSGFAVIRHKQYERAHPGSADTAVTVLATRNVLLVDAYAIYRLGNASGGSQFSSDWPKLVGTVVNRVG
ncbi:MAG TPA: hypothetical protein VGP91_00265 [Actinoplanes sp.]|jgi:hypothetical protein|nr:hypothetical protein [Actinoplanes sp.]